MLACIKIAAAAVGWFVGGNLARRLDRSNTAQTRLASRGQSHSQFGKISQPIS